MCRTCEELPKPQIPSPTHCFIIHFFSGSLLIYLLRFCGFHPAPVPARGLKWLLSADLLLSSSWLLLIVLLVFQPCSTAPSHQLKVRQRRQQRLEPNLISSQSGPQKPFLPWANFSSGLLIFAAAVDHLPRPPQVF